MDFLRVDPEYQPLFERLGLASCADAIAFFVDAKTDPARKSFVKRTVLAAAESSLPVFFKQYAFRKPSWRFLGRASKAQREFNNYEVFQRLGVACAERVACGEQRDALGRLRRAFLVTRAIPNGSTLLEFLPKHCPTRDTPEAKAMRAEIIAQLADMTRRIHEANFFHNDLFWRNIIVEWMPGQKLKLRWIDCPRGRFRSWISRAHRARMRDLGKLDDAGEKFMTRRERMTFLKIYLGQRRLDHNAKQLVRDVIAYRRKHWAD